MNKELQREVRHFYQGHQLTYTEKYYLDHPLDEQTNQIDRSKLEPHYTSKQVKHNLQELRKAWERFTS